VFLCNECISGDRSFGGSRSEGGEHYSSFDEMSYKPLANDHFLPLRPVLRLVVWTASQWTFW